MTPFCLKSQSTRLQGFLHVLVLFPSPLLPVTFSLSAALKLPRSLAPAGCRSLQGSVVWDEFCPPIPPYSSNPNVKEPKSSWLQTHPGQLPCHAAPASVLQTPQAQPVHPASSSGSNTWPSESWPAPAPSAGDCGNRRLPFSVPRTVPLDTKIPEWLRGSTRHPILSRTRWSNQDCHWGIPGVRGSLPEALSGSSD